MIQYRLLHNFNKNKKVRILVFSRKGDNEMELIAQIGFWHWFMLTMILVVMEFIRPGTFFLWLAIASGCVSVVTFINPAMAWSVQLMVFAIFSFAHQAYPIGRLR